MPKSLVIMCNTHSDVKLWERETPALLFLFLSKETRIYKSECEIFTAGTKR